MGAKGQATETWSLAEYRPKFQSLSFSGSLFITLVPQLPGTLMLEGSAYSLLSCPSCSHTCVWGRDGRGNLKYRGNQLSELHSSQQSILTGHVRAKKTCYTVVFLISMRKHCIKHHIQQCEQLNQYFEVCGVSGLIL